MHRLDRTARFGLELEAVHINLRARQELKSHGRNQDVVRARPLPVAWAKRCSVVDDPSPIFRKVEPFSERPLQIVAQWRHELVFGPSFFDFRLAPGLVGGPWLGFEKQLAALAAQPTNSMLLQEKVTRRKVLLWFDRPLQRA
jgi:hypothetical protein